MRPRSRGRSSVRSRSPPTGVTTALAGTRTPRGRPLTNSAASGGIGGQHRRRLDPRLPGERLEQLRLEGRLIAEQPGRVERQPQDQHPIGEGMFGAMSPEQIDQAAAGDDEQPNPQGDLSDQQRGEQPTPQRPARVGAGRLSQPPMQPRSGHAHQGGQADDHEQHGEHDQVDDHVLQIFGDDGGQACHVVGQLDQPAGGLQQQQADQQAAQATGHRQQPAFQQRLPEDAGRGGAERQGYRRLPAPAQGPAQELERQRAEPGEEQKQGGGHDLRTQGVQHHPAGGDLQLVDRDRLPEQAGQLRLGGVQLDTGRELTDQEHVPGCRVPGKRSGAATDRSVRGGRHPPPGRR